MRVVLLGSTGQLGSDIVRSWASRPAVHLTALTRRDIELSDIPSSVDYLKKIDFDVLINTTGYHKTDEVETNAQQAVLINAALPKALAEVCVEKHARLVHLSTDYVFGGQSKRTPLTEDDPTAPVNVYGATKLLGESLVAASGADALICRVSSLFGVAGASGKGGNFVETMLRLGRERGWVKVVSDQIMAPTATADIAEALLRLVEHHAPGGVYHVSGTGQASWYDFAKSIFDQAGLYEVSVEPVSTVDMPTPATRPAYSVLSNGKLAQTLGWSMPPWRDSLAHYLSEKGYRH